MKTLHVFGWVTSVFFLIVSTGLPVLAAEAEAAEPLPKMTPEDLSAQLNEPVKPMTADALRRGYEGKPLELLLAVRNARTEQVKQLVGELASAAEGEGAAPSGHWDERPEREWRRGKPTEVWALDDSAANLFQEAARQATLANDSAVWAALEPLLERLVAETVTSYASEIMLIGERREFDILLPHVRLDAPLVLYRLGKATTARETAVCFLAAGNSLKDNLLAALLEAGAKPDVRCLDDWTPLALAILRGNLRKVSLLLKHEAGPNTTSHGFTPLQLVEKSGLSESFKRELNKELVEHGAVR